MIFILLIMVPIILVCLFGLKSLYYAGAILAILYAAAIIKAQRSPKKTEQANQDYFSNLTSE
jgi:hypothetical protein